MLEAVDESVLVTMGADIEMDAGADVVVLPGTMIEGTVYGVAEGSKLDVLLMVGLTRDNDRSVVTDPARVGELMGTMSVLDSSGIEVVGGRTEMLALLVIGSLLIADVVSEVLEDTAGVIEKLTTVGISGIEIDGLLDVIGGLVDVNVMLGIDIGVVLISSMLELMIAGIMISGLVVLDDGALELGTMIEDGVVEAAVELGTGATVEVVLKNGTLKLELVGVEAVVEAGVDEVGEEVGVVTPGDELVVVVAVVVNTSGVELVAVVIVVVVGSCVVVTS